MNGQTECLVLYETTKINSSTVGDASTWIEDISTSQISPQARRRPPHKSPSPPEPPLKSRSLYESLRLGLESSPRVRQEVALKKRVGFYRLRGQLGAGNFSKVRLGIHLLTNGKSTSV